MSRKHLVSILAAVLLLLATASFAVWKWRSADSATTTAERTAPTMGASPLARPADQAAAASSTAAAQPAPDRSFTPIAATAQPDASATHGAFEGRVVNWSTGAGVAGAELTFEVSGAAASVATDAAGRFRFEPTEPGPISLAVIAKDGYLPFAPDWQQSPIVMAARPGVAVRDIVFFLWPAVDYHGRVVDGHGQPVAGATITLHLSDPMLPLERHYTSDSGGAFVFHAPDWTVLEAEHPDYGLGRAALDGNATITHRLEIRLPDKGNSGSLGQLAIAGTVIDSDKQPVAGARVRALRHGDVPTPEVQTDDRGQFHIAGLDPGSYQIRAQQSGYGLAEATAAAGQRNLRLTLAAGGAVEGRARFADGSTPAAFTVLVLAQKGALTVETVSSQTFLDSEGEFRIDSLSPGDYQLVAVAAGAAPGEQVRVTIPEPPAVARTNLTLRKGATIRGVLVDRATGQPLAQARVNLEASVASADSPLPVAPTALTDEAGRFAIEGVPPGRRSILAAAYMHHPRIVGGIEVSEGATIGPLTIDLAATAEGEQPRLELAGIGAALRVAGDDLVIDKVLEGGGAIEAGLGPGDIIIAVNGAPVAELGFPGAIQRIRGPENTTVILTVRRADQAGQQTLSVYRRRIEA